MDSNKESDYLLGLLELSREVARLSHTNTALVQIILQLSNFPDTILEEMRERIFSVRQEFVEASQLHSGENWQRIFDGLLKCLTEVAMEKKQEFIDYSQTISIGGDVRGEGNSSIVLGAINSEVRNMIGKLPDSNEPGQEGIKSLLSQLQHAVEESAELSPGKRATLLEQVKVLVEAQQETEPKKKAELVQGTKDLFGAILKGLPDTAKIVEACSKLMPMILSALGFPP